MNDLSRDGRKLLFTTSDLKTGYDVWMLSLDAGGKPAPLFAANFPETDGQLSPDGGGSSTFRASPGAREVFLAPLSGSGKTAAGLGGRRRTAEVVARWQGDLLHLRALAR
jgi:hypothetical protein